LGIPGEVQPTNASLAIALVEEHLRFLNLPSPGITSTSLPPEVITGLEKAHWPGRCETRVEADTTWCCDGAHTAESIAVATKWYSSM
jgi:folylpolyglutamate synthase